MSGQLSGYGETGHAGYADIAVSLAVKSVVDMLKMWVHKRTRAENNPTNHYQSKVWYLAMVIQTFKWNFSTSYLITRHSSIWITNDCIHCSLPSQLTKLAKSGIWHCQKWDMTLSSSMAMYSVMRDIYDARMVPMERGWVALFKQATSKY